MSQRPAARRTLLRGAAAVPVAGIGLTACGTEDNANRSTPTAPVNLGSADGVPDGGAEIFHDHNVVVSRKGDTYKAFSTICTHGRCPINRVEGTTLICPCHGSKFDATTGEVLHIPATQPLPEVPLKVTGGKLVAGPEA
ncbi:Rieske (2Fe-2S) protein [Streptomyces sp. NA04227]|uniref:Rieske (2Fe-2S) protein n=1 Tax=Streptomyces sp. NA04227 TaxID=2742136 RepID=UPI001590199D|nr:Rieske (2Fe-2S) protein [Streptomyces sp. NA04227]QKW05858.1 Rieske (2Fe-2S) protein [Streptomyces sp. NA04227]